MHCACKARKTIMSSKIVTMQSFFFMIYLILSSCISAEFLDCSSADPSISVENEEDIGIKQPFINFKYNRNNLQIYLYPGTPSVNLFFNETETSMQDGWNISNLNYDTNHKNFFNSDVIGVANIKVSADHRVRPIIVPRDLSRLPWCAGYAECINAGKSTWNEDQATAMRGDLKLMDSNTSIPYIMYSMFDGHAGYQVALTARLHLHRIILEKLMAIPAEMLLSENNNSTSVKGRDLIIGAIELAYRQMDQMVEHQSQRGGGGCTSITVLFLNGRMYAAGAGDSRTILVLEETERALTRDHTPDSESNRVRALGYLKSGELLKGHFTSLEFKKRPLERDLGSMVLYREPYMTGWAYKVLSHTDLLLPLISGQGKRSRVMGIIGVTRGFGDHGLKAANTGVSIKPFLSSQPEIQSLDLEDFNLNERDCIILATDGLWDVVSDETAANILRKTLEPDNPSLEYRLTMAAQELVQAARGSRVGRVWRLKNEIDDDEAMGMASVDDISVMVVPLYPYLCEHKQWVKTQQQERRHSINSLQSLVNDAT